jgi:hypothetical protein
MSTQTEKTERQRMIELCDSVLRGGGTTQAGSMLSRVRDFLVDQEKCATFLEPLERAGMQAYVDLVYDHAAVKAGLAPHHREWVTDAHVSAVLTAIHRIAQARMPTVKLGPNAAEELLVYDVHDYDQVAQAYRTGYKVERRYAHDGKWFAPTHSTVGEWVAYFANGGKARAVKA